MLLMLGEILIRRWCCIEGIHICLYSVLSVCCSSVEDNICGRVATRTQKKYCYKLKFWTFMKINGLPVVCRYSITILNILHCPYTFIIQCRKVRDAGLLRLTACGGECATDPAPSVCPPLLQPPAVIGHHNCQCCCRWSLAQGGSLHVTFHHSE